MTAPVVMTITAGTLAVGPEGGPLVQYDCQVVSAAVNPTPNMQTQKATFCAGETQVPGATGWELVVNVLQDWSADATSFCWFSIDNDAQVVEWEVALQGGLTAPADAPVTMHGQAYCVPFPFGGDAGTPLEATQTWPIIGKPVQGPSTVTLAARAPASSSAV